MPTADAALPSRVRLAPGAVRDLQQVLGAARRVLVVHGRRSFRTGTAAAAVDDLDAEVRDYGGVHPNPELRQVREAVALARDYGPDAVVGIGGGSAMDVAKCVAVLAQSPGDPGAYLLDPGAIAAHRAVALVQIPTISGSGSELTSFATVYAGRRKLSLDHPSALADHVLIDPDLTSTVPAPTAAASALDALAQAIESAWAVAATAESRRTAILALETLLPALDSATRHGSFADPWLRTELAHGAALAGAAINITRTTAAHALSYALTARHGIAHGAAVGLHLRWLIGHNAAATDIDTRHPDGAEALRLLVADLRRRCLGAIGVPVEELIDRLLDLHGLRNFRIPLRDWRDDLSSGRAANNPRLVTPQDVLTGTSGRTTGLPDDHVLR
ncbi:hypothetical protein GCM10010172_34570 [Paractinoplanes ferrugineus]|uniref:Alcohol dehydrogenase class IV n=1 Tax=Paractinoplanes ferrugineus TaxID=113564 RepID=A0A919J804_9ACTN|nr:iron-containing alcohol dehydrogenase [Actinoplanes ferrugineus]GIE15470.1 hypothetical protein Afe05nite_73100 [Actinoplanes ferrugineus]